VSTIGIGVIDCQVSVFANGKTSAHLKYVFKMSTPPFARSRTQAGRLPDRYIDDHLVEMFPLFDKARLQLVDVTNLAAVHTILQLPPNLAVDWIKVRTAGWPQSWSDEVWCFKSNRMMHCLTCSVGWTPECLTAVCNAWKLKYFVVNI